MPSQHVLPDAQGPSPAAVHIAMFCGDVFTPAFPVCSALVATFAPKVPQSPCLATRGNTNPPLGERLALNGVIIVQLLWSLCRFAPSPPAAVSPPNSLESFYCPTATFEPLDCPQGCVLHVAVMLPVTQPMPSHYACVCACVCVCVCVFSQLLLPQRHAVWHAIPVPGVHLFQRHQLGVCG